MKRRSSRHGGGLLGRFQAMIRDEEQREQEQRSRQDAERMEALIDEQVNDHAFYSGGLGSIEDILASREFNLDGNGWYVGTLPDQHGFAHLVFYSPPKAIYIEGTPGSGKGLHAQANLAHLAGSASVVLVDFDNECWNTASGYWSQVCGPESTVLIDLDNGEGQQANPLAVAIRLAQAGKIDELLTEIEETVATLKPDPEKTGDTHWILKDAKEILGLAIYARARYSPESCFLPVIHDDCSTTFLDLLENWTRMIDVNTDSHLYRGITKFTTLFNNRPEHGGWWLQEITADTRYFAPETQLGQVLSGDSIDFSMLKQSPHLLSIGVKTHRTEQAKRAVALIARAATEAASADDGPFRTYILWDEAPVVGCPKLADWARTLRKRNVVPVVISQNKSALDESLGEKKASDFRSSCGLTQYLSITEQAVADDLQAMSGTRPSVIRTISSSKGPVEQGGISTSTQSEPNLHAADLRVMDARYQVVRAANHPLFVMEHPPWWMIEPWCDQLKKF